MSYLFTVNIYAENSMYCDTILINAFSMRCAVDMLYDLLEQKDIDCEILSCVRCSL